MNETKEYRFKYQIVDDEDNVIQTGNSYISPISPDGSCESIELELFAGLRAFKKQLDKSPSDYVKEELENNQE